MILLPDLETIVLLVPRTGSGSMKNAILERHKNAMFLYRHMEADGIPVGYENWRKVGVVRNPIDRLWSLYKFLKNFNGPYPAHYIKKQRDSVKMDFSTWIVENDTIFTTPVDYDGTNKFYPFYNVIHHMPENMKSQYLTLRPDLGTEIWHFNDKHKLAEALGVNLGHANKTEANLVPKLSEKAHKHMNKVFAWDFKVSKMLEKC